MKKSWRGLVLLGLLISISGCSKNAGNGALDTTATAVVPAVPTGATSQIMPPGAANPTKNITVTIGKNPIDFKGNFVGKAQQTVEIDAPDGTKQNFSSADGANWKANPVAGKSGDKITVIASITGSAYLSSPSVPEMPQNNSGTDQTTYQDAIGNSSVINIQEENVPPAGTHP